MIPVIHIVTATGEGEYESTILRLRDIRAVTSAYQASELKESSGGTVKKSVDADGDSTSFGNSSTRSLKFQTVTDHEIEVEVDKDDCRFEIYLDQPKEGEMPYLQTRNLPIFLGALIGILTKG